MHKLVLERRKRHPDEEHIDTSGEVSAKPHIGTSCNLSAQLRDFVGRAAIDSEGSLVAAYHE